MPANSWTESDYPALDDEVLKRLNVTELMRDLPRCHNDVCAQREVELAAHTAYRAATENLELLQAIAINDGRVVGKDVKERAAALTALEETDEVIRGAIKARNVLRDDYDRAANDVNRAELAYDTTRRQMHMAEAILNYLAARP